MVGAWLRANPHLVQERSITPATLLACTTLAKAREEAVDEAVAAAADIDGFTEREAARDVLEHNEWVVNEVCPEKAGPAAAFAVDDLVEPDDAAVDGLYDLTLRLAGGGGAHAGRAGGYNARTLNPRVYARGSERPIRKDSPYAREDPHPVPAP